MAMRLFTEAEFIAELASYGLTATSEYHPSKKHRIFKHQDGYNVFVPWGHKTYPDYILDDLLAHLNSSWQGDGSIPAKIYGVDGKQWMAAKPKAAGGEEE